VVARQRLEPGKTYRICNIDLICGEVSRNDNGTFNIPWTEILVERTDETEEAYFVFVTRLSDDTHFRINATKPGPWKQYIVAELMGVREHGHARDY
jgi:hypothetical protein